MFNIKTYYIKQGKQAFFKKFTIEDDVCLIKRKLDSHRNITKTVQQILNSDIRYTILSDELKTNEEFVNMLIFHRVKIFDGKWLYKFLLKEIIEYIESKTLKIGNKNSDSNFEITLLAKNITDELIGNLEELREKYKNIRIVSLYPGKFKKIEEKVFKESGYPLIITSNRKKSLAKSNIIINYDLDEKEINQFNIFENAIIINFSSDIKINKKRFNGIIVNDYSLKDNNKEIIESEVYLESLNYAVELKYNLIRKNIEDKHIEISKLIAKNHAI